MPSGDLPPNPAELLGTQRMSALLEELSDQVDVVIVEGRDQRNGWGGTTVTIELPLCEQG